MSHSRTLIISLLSWLILSSPTVSAEDGVSDREILLGQSASFTGSFAEQAAAYRDGAQLYFDHVNKKGGVHGRAIRLLSLDDGYKAENAVANTKQLIEKDKVFSLFNYTWTNTVKASLPLASEAKVPMFAPYTGYEELYSQPNRFVFTTRANFSDELGTIIRHLMSIGLKHISLVRYDSLSGKELLLETEQRLAKYEVKLDGVGMMKSNSKDPKEAVKALKAIESQVIILGMSGSDAVSFIRAYETETGRKPYYFARSLINAKQLSKELGAQARGISVTQTAPNPFKAAAPIAKEYRRLLSEKNAQAEPDYIALEGFIAAKVFVHGLELCGKNLTRERLISALESIKELELGGYSVKYSASNHHGSRYVDITLIGLNGRTFD